MENSNEINNLRGLIEGNPQSLRALYEILEALVKHVEVLQKEMISIHRTINKKIPHDVEVEVKRNLGLREGRMAAMLEDLNACKTLFMNKGILDREEIIEERKRIREKSK